MKFINPTNVVAQMGLKPGQTVADLGCGGGFFVLAAAKMVGNSGTVYGVDVQEAKLTATQSAAAQQGFTNVQIIKADLDKAISDIQETSCDAVIMASILHEVGNRENLLKNAYRILKTGGLLLAVEWKPDHSPFGPALQKRIPEPELEQEMSKLGLKKVKTIPADMYHYAIVFQK